MSEKPESVIEMNHLTKYYGSREVLRDVSLNVPRGCIYGFLGRNGIGKTTTIRVCLGFESATRGSATVFGEDSANLPPNIRGRIGYLPEGHFMYGWMTVKECGQFQAAYFPSWQQDIFEAVISHFQLGMKMHAGNLSRGQRAGLSLAQTLAYEPELLVLDDPALGLDPVARRSLLQSMLYVTRQTDRTIFFSSHMLSDVERVADRIAVLDGGVLRADCTVDTFRQRIKNFILRFGETPPDVRGLPGLLQSFRSNREVALTVANVTPEVQARIEALHPLSIEAAEMTLEDAFISYVGERGEKTFFMNDKEK